MDLTGTSVIITSTSGDVSIPPGTVLSDAEGIAIVHGGKNNRGDPLDPFKKDNVEVIAHLADACVDDILNNVSRTLRAQAIHEQCQSVGSTQLTNEDGRATVALSGGTSYILTGHNLEDPTIWYKSRILQVDVGETQKFGFNKFTVPLN